MRGIARPGRRLPLAAALLALACAKMGPPPGGPPDQVAPRLIARFPDSSEVLPNFRADAEFTFDEVISEGTAPNFGLGNGTLESLILLSPSDEVPVVRWRRDRITVRPREGWQNGRVYRIELRPGVADLRTNRLDQPAVITFTTGAVQPRTVLRGTVVDWTSRRPQAGGIVEAILMPDSLSYRSVADSTGAFTLGPLPAGEYLVYAGVDQNRNFRVDAREIFDSVRVAAGEQTVGEIWAFRHDSVGPRIQTVALRDSVTIVVSLNQMIDPRQPMVPRMARVRRLPDSTEIGVVAIHPPAIFDSLFPASRGTPLTAADSARADSVARARARADSVRADSLLRAQELEAERQAADARRGIVRRSDAPTQTRQLAPLTSRPALVDRVQIRVDSILAPGGRYIVELNGIRNPNGASTPGLLVLVVPEPPPAPPPPDSTAVPPDTSAVRPPGTVPPGRARR